MNSNKIIITIFLALFFLNSLVSAEELKDTPVPAAVAVEESHADVSGDEKYLFPVIPPEIGIYGGYRFVSEKGAATADEYEYLHNSLLFGGDMRHFSFPHRFHLNFDIENRKDYYGDISYAYEDIVILRGINRTLYHNLDNYRLYDGDPSNTSYRINDEDNTRNYGVRVGMNAFFARFKTHDFPFHLYAEGGVIDRKGSQQQISYLKSGTSSSSGYRTSMPRDIDFRTKTLTVGANSHLGPIELDISHGEKRFTASGDQVLYGDYLAVGSDRAPGVYQHNLIPEIKSSSNTIKLHTSFTGGIVASATLSKAERENQDSGAKASLLIGAGDISWTASPQLAFFLKYRYRDNDVENPDHVTITDRSKTYTSTYAVKDSISSVTNTVTGIVRYRPASGIVLKGEYTYENINRSHVESWGSLSEDPADVPTAYKFPDSTTRSTATLSADLRLMKVLNLKLKYTHRDNDNPAYNVEPDTADEGRISLSWRPVPQVSSLLSYSLAKEKRSSVEGVSEDAGDRKVLRDRLFGSVTFMLQRELSLTTSYSYMHNRTEQDIAIGGGASGVENSDVPNKIASHIYGIDLNYSPRNTVSLSAGVNHVLSSGQFFPSEAALLNRSIGEFSALKTRETVFYASGEYRLNHGYAFGIQYKYTRLDDLLNNKYDDVLDGKAHIVFLTLSKKW